MKEVSAHFISGNSDTISLAEVSVLFDQNAKEPIDNVLWTGNGYKPEVCFALAYSNKSILLKYWVKEKYIRAHYREINDPVYKDSCVEAFIAFDDQGYYNLEFSCAGTPLAGYGTSDADRVFINRSLVALIGARPVIRSQAKDALIEWELTLNIPFAVFEYHDIKSLKNKTAKMNFYKCGDELPEPHFLSWSPVVNAEPNFHLPEFFGQVKFADH